MEMRIKLEKLWDEYCQRGYENILSLRCFKKLFEEVEEFLLIPQSQTIVLDGGCGTGGMFQLILEKIKPSKIVAADFSESMLERAKKEADKLVSSGSATFEFWKVDLTQPFPWQDGAFDAEVFNLLISYLPNHQWENVIQEAYRTLKPNGYCYITITAQKDFRKEIRKWFFRELLSPIAFLKAIKVIPAVNKLDDFVKRGVINPPQPEEVVRVARTVGFGNVEIADAMGKSAQIIRLQRI